MSQVPISPSDLDSVVYKVARDLIEDKAINGLIDGVTEQETQKVVDEVGFIINKYMFYVNEIFNSQAIAQIDKK